MEIKITFNKKNDEDFIIVGNCVRVLSNFKLFNDTIYILKTSGRLIHYDNVKEFEIYEEDLINEN